MRFLSARCCTRSTWRARCKRLGCVTGAVVLRVAVTLQAALGIATLLQRVPLALALLHQAMAMLVLTIATTHAALVADRRVAGGSVAARGERSARFSPPAPAPGRR